MDNAVLSTGNSQLTRTEVDANVAQEPEVVDESRGSSPSDATSSELERRSSTGSSSSEASVAVNCSKMPAEVVVHGRRGVQTVRLLFTPQPPSTTVLSSVERRLRPSHRMAPLALRPGRRTPSISTQVTDSDVSGLQFPTEESSSGCFAESDLPRNHSDSYPSGHRNIGMPRNASLPDPLASNTGFPVCFSAQLSSVDNEDGDNNEQSAWEQEERIRQEILKGLNFLERRNHFLRSTNERLTRKVDALILENEQFRRAIEDKETRLASAETSYEELKNQLDQLGKENMMLNEKALDEWKLRVGVEEKSVDEKRRSDVEIKSLKDEVDRMNAEIKLLQCLIQNNNTDNLIGTLDDDVTRGPEDSKRRKEERIKSSSDEDVRDLVNRVTSLQATVDAVSNERSRLGVEVEHLRSEATSWRERFEAKCNEYEVLFGQFDSQRVTLHHLKAENRNLRAQYVQIHSGPPSSKPSLDNGNGSGNATPAGSLLNATWPKQETKTATTTASSGALLHISNVQLPLSASVGAASGSLKNRSGVKDSAAMPVALNPRVGTVQHQHQQQQRRRKSDESSSGLSCSSVDSLPPVSQNHSSSVSKYSK